MTGVVVLIAVLVGFTALALWLEHSRADVWSWLYGTTDPRELVDRAHEPRRLTHHPRCAVELGFNSCTCSAFGGAA